MTEYQAPPPPDENPHKRRFAQRPIMPAVKPRKATRDKILDHANLIEQAKYELERAKRKGLAR
jgi:hypothetical protein